MAGIVAGVSVAAWLGMQAFEANVMFYFDPSDLAAKMPPAGERFRLGGMVEKGSVEKTSGTLDIKFLVTDFKHTVRGEIFGHPAGPVPRRAGRGRARPHAGGHVRRR